MRIKYLLLTIIFFVSSCVVQPVSNVNNENLPSTLTYSECVWPTVDGVSVWNITNIPTAAPEISYDFQIGTIVFRTDFRISDNDDSMIHLSIDGQTQARDSNLGRYVGLGRIVHRIQDDNTLAFCGTRMGSCYVYEAPVYFWYVPEAVHGLGYSVVAGWTLSSGRSLRTRVNICAQGRCLLGEEQVVQVRIINP